MAMSQLEQDKVKEFLLEKINELKKQGVLPVTMDANKLVKHMMEALTAIPGMSLEKLQSKENELRQSIVFAAAMVLNPNISQSFKLQQLINMTTHLSLDPENKLSAREKERQFTNLLKLVNDLQPEEKKLNEKELNAQASALTKNDEQAVVDAVTYLSGNPNGLQDFSKDLGGAVVANALEALDEEVDPTATKEAREGEEAKRGHSIHSPLRPPGFDTKLHPPGTKGD